MRVTQGTFSFLPDLTDAEITEQVRYATDRGWPVALMGHGITSSMYADAWAVAPQLAAAGIATAAIHYAGHGGGERGTLR